MFLTPAGKNLPYHNSQETLNDWVANADRGGWAPSQTKKFGATKRFDKPGYSLGRLVRPQTREQIWEGVRVPGDEPRTRVRTPSPPCYPCGSDTSRVRTSDTVCESGPASCLLYCCNFVDSTDQELPTWCVEILGGNASQNCTSDGEVPTDTPDSPSFPSEPETVIMSTSFQTGDSEFSCTGTDGTIPTNGFGGIDCLKPFTSSDGVPGHV